MTKTDRGLAKAISRSNFLLILKEIIKNSVSNVIITIIYINIYYYNDNNLNKAIIKLKRAKFAKK